MENSNFIIKNGQAVFSEGILKADISIKDGIFESIGKDLDTKLGYKVIDATDKYVLPGLIDAHVHPQYADGFESLSESAAFGGITTLIHYVYAKKGMNLIEKVEEAIDEGTKVSYLDFALHASLQDVENQIQHIGETIELGVTSFKMFMPFGKRGMSVDDSLLIAAMDKIGSLGGLSMVHAENSACEYLEEKFVEEGKISSNFYPQSRPSVLEADAVSRAMILADTVGCPLYLVHLSARESLEQVNKARYTGRAVYTETCPHYLTLTDEIFDKIGALAKCAPPIRKSHDVDEMWTAIKNNLIDVVASDHAGYTKEKKEFENVFESAFGIPGTETMFSLLYEEGVYKRRIDFPKLVKVLSENPAKIFGLYPKKGTLQIGSDADLVIFDPKSSYMIEESNQHGNSDFTVYEGWKCHGKPVLSMQRGRVVLKNGSLYGEPGNAAFLSRGKFNRPIL
jgi:dihydropyrimidinase